MKLYALSDLHLNYAANRAAIHAVTPHPEDWLILAGDLGDTPAQLQEAFEVFGERFARLLWVPGNHELWTHPKDPEAERGEARYRQWVELARAHGVLTPEDAPVLWQGEGGLCWLVPLCLLYDFSFHPGDVADGDELAWAEAHGIRSNDERYLHADPFPDVPSWCRARVAEAEARLAALDPAHPTVLINHWQLRYELVRIPRIQRFSLWCGTRATEDWHRRFRAKVVVSGHLHVRTTDWIDGTRFEEVATGYPRHWDTDRGLDGYLREILPGPPPPPGGAAPAVRHP